MNKFEIKDDFYLNDKKIKIISGGMHYFRILPEYWRDRLLKLKALGCNTVETYIPWNLHEKHKGVFDFRGILDITKYVKTAQELDLMVILRPSPYICGEWEFGGFPYWLLKDDGMRLRCMYEPYLQHIREYYQELFKVIAPLQITRGGSVILMQLENEYGYYGDDPSYMEFLKNLMIENGCEVPLVTSDGPWGDAFECGKASGVLQTGNFGSKSKSQFGIMKKKIGNKPLMCMEFWVGWFDYWGGEHHTGDTQQHVKDLDDILSDGHVNIYMFEGGTNFGFMNGANYYGKLEPDVTSYDYDALLTEDGQITQKYRAFQNIIKKYADIPECLNFNEIKRKSYGTFAVTKTADFFQSLDYLSTPIESSWPVCMEKLNQGYGYILYESTLSKLTHLEKIRLWKANDRASIYIDDTPILTLYDRDLLTEHELENISCNNGKFDILVENMGRVNFTPIMENQRKGIDGGVQLNGHLHFGWKIYSLPMEDLSNIDYTIPAKAGLPGFYEFQFDLEEPADTFLDMKGWGKGFVVVNNFNIGRFWDIGPQKRLYVPAPLLRKGQNSIIIFETEGKTPGTICLFDTP
ncbi:MAG: beta-galactosidase [Clostridiales bacterium]|nr:beta-galactosidase [Clostridiales bacterium]